MKDFDDDPDKHYKNFYEGFEKLEKEKNHKIDKTNNTEKHFSCLYPKHSIPTFKIEKDKLKISCQCGFYNNTEFEYKDVIKNFVHIINDCIKLDDYYKCQDKHHEDEEFKYYCKNCNQHLCRICLQKTAIHSNHKLVILRIAKIESDILAESLIEEINNNQDFDKDLKELFNIIYDNFNKYPFNYSYYCIFKLLIIFFLILFFLKFLSKIN